MTTPDWTDARREIAAADRKRLGDPPTAEEMLAYTRGELPAAEEQRIHELLAAYPELARTLAAPFPDDDGGLISEQELDKRWAQFGWRARASRPRAPYAWTALAAAIALVFAGLYFQAAIEQNRPRAISISEHLVLPDGHRGGGSTATVLKPDGDAVLLRVALMDDRPLSTYRVELKKDERTLWTGTAAPSHDGTLPILVPRAFLEPGNYQLLVLSEDEHIGSYSLRVPESSVQSR